MKPKPICQTVLPWLKANLGDKCLAPLTGQDSRALGVAVSAMALYVYAACDGDAETNAIIAFRAAVLSMQPSTRHLAYHSIAHVLDWPDRPRIWERAGLELIAAGKCKFE